MSLFKVGFMILVHRNHTDVSINLWQLVPFSVVHHRSYDKFSHFIAFVFMKHQKEWRFLSP